MLAIGGRVGEAHASEDDPTNFYICILDSLYIKLTLGLNYCIDIWNTLSDPGISETYEKYNK